MAGDAHVFLSQSASCFVPKWCRSGGGGGRGKSFCLLPRPIYIDAYDARIDTGCLIVLVLTSLAMQVCGRPSVGGMT